MTILFSVFTDYTCIHVFIVSVIEKEDLVPAKPFFYYDNDNDLKACFSVTWLIYVWKVADSIIQISNYCGFLSPGLRVLFRML